QRSIRKPVKRQDLSTELPVYKHPRHHAHTRATRRFRQLQRPESDLPSSPHKNLPSIGIKLAAWWVARGQKQLFLLQIGAFPRQQFSLYELRCGILDELLLFG